ncbi:hypothetical protein [Gallibacterium genomosp. 3]|uniref:Uncharacterized protein n=1 Tax=Gallibacterium genomosp. 3 TaxID=505345 RepID=A0A1A7PWQ9_9PAST|nr:hypothetical protein [Gallibacterium genomosp. 3]OBX06186.1 hypothetical protein QV07_08880 [Gallibacterium genomosp. 3]
MSQFYKSLRNISSKLIKQFGVECKVKKETAGQYNPATGGVSGGIVTNNDAYCLFDNLNYDFPSYKSVGTSKGSDVMVQQGDVVIYVTAEGKPSINAIIEVNNELWKVITCQPIKPANSEILYQIQARKVG